MYCNIRYFCVLNQPANRSNIYAIFCSLQQDINLEISKFHIVEETTRKINFYYPKLYLYVFIP